jgi:flavin-dependent dehydrogenase
MCGGVISESLVQTLAAEGISMPSTVVQRGIESYMLHTDVGKVRIDSPKQEARIAAVHRGLGPRTLKEVKWDSFDGYLQNLAVKKGAVLIQDVVKQVSWSDGRPQLKTKGGSSAIYDLLVVASGVNSATLKLFKQPEFDYKPPLTVRTVIFEYFLGEDAVGTVMGGSMHVFLLNLPRLEFAAIIPKGDYVTVCMLGEDIDNQLVESFLNSPEVKAFLPPELLSNRSSCNCKPKINVKAALQPFADRVLFVGDSGVTRLYKDGIGAAYRTGKAAATAVVFQGISAESFKQHYWPVCRAIRRDNSYGRLTFAFTRQIQKWQFARRALINMIASEQRSGRRSQYVSRAMWDVFTGSAPYKEILLRMVHPVQLVRLFWNLVISVLPLRANRH